MTAIGFTHGLNLGNDFVRSSELNAARIGAIAVQLVSSARGDLVGAIGQRVVEPDRANQQISV
jgi:hypothetical protein